MKQKLIQKLSKKTLFFIVQILNILVTILLQNQKRIRRWQHQYNKVKVFEVEARERKHNNQKLSQLRQKGVSPLFFIKVLFIIALHSS